MPSKDENKLNSKFHKEMAETLREAASILDGKTSDYGHDSFQVGAAFASMITGKEVTATEIAAGLVGQKMARYKTLINSDGKPVNESLHDTIVDWVNYIVLMERERKKDAERERPKQGVQEKPASQV
ncbi:MAG: hypothetical protein FVQ80_11530 [Planctomycetes bacterium]|nr:hypothetical protein [Planctomycetota bacterium]